MDKSPEQEFIESIQVVAGSPTDDELAAVIAVLKETYQQQQSAGNQSRSTWSKNASLLRTQVIAGNGQWGSSYKPGL